MSSAVRAAKVKKSTSLVKRVCTEDCQGRGESFNGH